MKKKIFILSLLFLNLSLFSVPGDWKQLGKPGEWKGTIAGAVISNSLYTVEQDGTLYVTDLTNGKWTKIGKPEFAHTLFMFANNNQLFTIEGDGSLYAIDIK